MLRKISLIALVLVAVAVAVPVGQAKDVVLRKKQPADVDPPA